MILFVSGRTDVVAFYSEWFMRRYHEGFVDVRNPFFGDQVRRINFDRVDLILFCTKNPLPIIANLSEITIPILFHITITPYGKEIEPNVIDKRKIIEGIKKISTIIGKENVYIRYDPIIVNDKYTVDYHKRSFARLCFLLHGYVEHIIVSFVDDYKNVRKNMAYLKIKDLSDDDYREIGLSFSQTAKKYGMTVQTCAEENNLSEYGFIKKDCLDKTLAYLKTGKTNFKKWQARGKKCQCVEMVDIGVYNSCKHFCRYCYANYDELKVSKNFSNHNSNSSLLVGHLGEYENVKEYLK